MEASARIARACGGLAWRSTTATAIQANPAGRCIGDAYHASSPAGHPNRARGRPRSPSGVLRSAKFEAKNRDASRTVASAERETHSKSVHERGQRCLGGRPSGTYRGEKHRRRRALSGHEETIAAGLLRSASRASLPLVPEFCRDPNCWRRLPPRPQGYGGGRRSWVPRQVPRSGGCAQTCARWHGRTLPSGANGLTACRRCSAYALCCRAITPRYSDRLSALDAYRGPKD